MTNYWRSHVRRRWTFVYSVVQLTAVRAVQESSSPDTQKQIKELHVRHLSGLIISSDGKPVFELNFGICR